MEDDVTGEDLIRRENAAEAMIRKGLQIYHAAGGANRLGSPAAIPAHQTPEKWTAVAISTRSTIASSPLLRDGAAPTTRIAFQSLHPLGNTAISGKTSR